MAAELLCMGEPMLELNQQSTDKDGRRLYLEGFGGDTSNAAIAAARQGAKSGYITAIGQDGPGDAFMSLWTEEGVDSSTVLRTPGAPTGMYLVTHGPKGHAFHFYRANSAAARYTPADLPEAAIKSAKMLYASGISQGISGSAADAVFKAVEIAKAAGVTFAYDTNYRAGLWPAPRAAATIMATVAKADIALPGLEDTTLLTGIEEADAMLDLYLGFGCKVVALKMGADGTYLATKEGRTRIPPFPCKPIDATGAGDTFCGSFLARILAGDTPAEAARYAACAAALSTQGYGAVAPIPKAEQVRAALKG